jgi:GMP synthase (glutamine-hydrolysing)
MVIWKFLRGEKPMKDHSTMQKCGVPIRPFGKIAAKGADRLNAFPPFSPDCRWAILQHVAWEGPGLIASVARARGLPVETHRLDLNSTVPKLEDVSGLIVMGGPMGAYETEKYPFLAQECSLISEMVRRGRPVLGVCLGAQLLAKSLGARVFPGPASEIGFGSVRLAPAASADPVFAPSGTDIPVFHWHGDTFELPIGATLLASSPMYAHQAFRFGQCVYALQFHLEVDVETWSAWEPHLPSTLRAPAAELRPRVEDAGRSVIERFFDEAAKPRRAPEAR